MTIQDLSPAISRNKRVSGLVRVMFHIAWCACLGSTAGQAATADLLDLATISMTNPNTPKVINKGVCYSDGRDLACDGAAGVFVTSGTLGLTGISVTTVTATTLSAYALAAGNVSATGNISANKFIGDGSLLTGVSGGGGGGATNVIASGTTSVTTNSNGYISLSTGGTTTGYFDTAGRLVVPGISITQNYGISATNVYIGNKFLIGPSTTLPADTVMDVMYNGTIDGIYSTRFSSDGATYGANLNLRRASGTSSAPTALFANDVMGVIAANGYTGVGVWSKNTAAIRFLAAENYTVSTSIGSYIQLMTTPIGSNSRQTRMTIADSGNVGIGTTAPTTALEVSGTISATALTVGGESIDFSVDTVSIPDETNQAWGKKINSSIAVVSGLGPGVVTVARVSGDGTPTINNGSAALIFNGSNLQLALTTPATGSSTRTATLTYGSKSLTWNVTTGANPVCTGGNGYNNACWYVGSQNATCTSVCASRGGYNATGTTWAAASNANCRDVFDNAFTPGFYGSGLPSSGSTGPGTGCVWTGTRYRNTGTVTEGATYATHQRLCGCNN